LKCLLATSFFCRLTTVCSSATVQQTSDRCGRWDVNNEDKVTREMAAWLKDSFDEVDTNKDGVFTSDEKQQFRPTNAQGRANPRR
jgi:hypothetical protein